MDGTLRSTSSAAPRRRVVARRPREELRRHLDPIRRQATAFGHRRSAISRSSGTTHQRPVRHATHASALSTHWCLSSPASRDWRRPDAASPRRSPATAPAPTARAARRKHVKPRTSDPAVAQRIVQCRKVNHRPAAAKLTQHRVRLHPSQLPRADHVACQPRRGTCSVTMSEVARSSGSSRSARAGRPPHARPYARCRCIARSCRSRRWQCARRACRWCQDR